MPSCPFCETPVPEDLLPGDGAGLVACTGCFNPILVTWKEGDCLVARFPDHRDMRRNSGPDTIAGAILAQAGPALQQLPVLPEISQRILTLLRDPEFGMPELAGMIREDPAIALAIMKQANSAAFGGLSPIKDLNGACARLGMRNVANTVQIVANQRLFVAGNPRVKITMQLLWRHSVAAAYCAGQIARLTLAPDPEAVFLAGLVHDAGKLFLLQAVGNPEIGVLRDVEDNPELFREILDSMHPLFGLLVCQAWTLPAEFRAAAFFHHRPEQCPEADWLPLVHTVALANTIVRVEGYGMYPAGADTFLASHPSTQYLGLSDIKLAMLRVDLRDALEALFEATS